MQHDTAATVGPRPFLTRDERAIRRRRWLWIGVAALVLAGGSIATVVAATATARNDAERAEHEVEAAALSTASTLRLAIQREEDLLAAARAFVAENPEATNAAFTRWVEAVDALERSPALEGVGLAVLVEHDDLDAFAARIAADPSVPGVTFERSPPGDRPFYCFVVSSPVSPDIALELPIGLDYCATDLGPDLLRARDTGEGTVIPFEFTDTPSLLVMSPVYVDAVMPPTEEARREAFLGWVGTSSVPDALLTDTLGARDDLALVLRYEDGGEPLTFAAGDRPSRARTIAVGVGDDWTLEVSGSVASRSILANATARTVLIAGLAASILFAALVVVLATGRARALALVAQKTDELRYRALHDGLTGLPNRTLLLDRLDQLVARTRRHGTQGAVLYVDLDGFKTVNDTLGHDAGDRLLQAAAGRLTSALRDVDTIGRMGGDEFVVLIDGGELEVAPELVAERLLDVMRQPFDLGGDANPVVVTASVGVAVGRDRSPDEMLRDADLALYEAKGAGRNRAEVFRPSMESTMRHRAELELDVRGALERGELRLVYQPIYELDGLTPVGVEALLRWEHPKLGVIAPEEFVPLLEANAQILDVGRWVLLTACAQLADWRSRGHRLGISVNVSARQLERDRLIDDVRDALAQSRLPADALTVEITETTLMHDIERAARRLEDIKSIGVHIAVDDFGSGYSSLAHIQRFPIDTLKIDRAFVDAIHRSPESDALIHTLVQLGQDLGLQTLAEGVEEPHQIDHLRERHVDHAQGFLLARPLDPETLETQVLDPASGRARHEA